MSDSDANTGKLSTVLKTINEPSQLLTEEKATVRN